MQLIYSMGHVSDFNGMNACDEADLNHATSDLIAADNILDLPLTENFMPIYHSFPDDIYRQPHLYASNNLSSFLSNDDDRNGYFDESLELDLFFDSNFNIDFDPPDTILENDSSIVHNNIANEIKNEVTSNEKNGNCVQFKQENESICTTVQNSSSQVTSYSDIDSQEKHESIVNNFNSVQSSETKTYTTETVFGNLESSDKKEQIPKLIIKLKPELSTDQKLSNTEDSVPLTIADKVKLSSRKNGNLKCDEIGQKKEKSVKKHKTHKRKSRHKNKSHIGPMKNGILETNQNINGKLSNCSIESFTDENIFLNQNSVYITGRESKTSQCSPKTNIDWNCQVPNNNTSFISNDSYQCDSDHMSHNIKTEPVHDEIFEKVLSKPSTVTDSVDFQFEFENANALSMSPSNNVKKEDDNSIDNFLEHIDIKKEDYDSLDSENIPDKSFLEEIKYEKTESSTENSLFNGILKEDFDCEEENRSVSVNEPTKSSSASDLIEELNAHHQQVFEEIEISTPELELEINDTRTSTKKEYSKVNDTQTQIFSKKGYSKVNKKRTQISIKNQYSEASQPPQNSANVNSANQNKVAVEHCEKNFISQNILSTNKNFSLSSQTTSPYYSSTDNHKVTARPRNVSSSGSSVTSKSSTSHRSYRKRRRSSSSSSSCSDREKFYNRPVKFDPATQTYCDEFGREIRPNELKYYLNSKSNHRDLHSNNGSSSSSRSKSPRYKKYHRKHHKSRSDSRSHRRRRHSSSCSRSRSRSPGRRYKDDFDRKCRSPSPKHRSKRHYLEVEENMRAYEERRVMYVGDIPPNYTVEELKERFGRFGPIQTASIKSKFTADGSLYIFGFVTFKNRSDVCQAIERGNENPSWPRFDLNFGGRRRFCNGNYTDLDGKVAEAESGWYGHQNSFRQQPPRQEDDFAELLRQEQRRLGMSKK